jgi:cytochrome c oxidase subunit II
VLVLSGCGSKTDILHPHGPQAKDVASLWWWLLGGCSFGLLFVTALLVLAWVRRRSSGPGREPGERAGWIVVLTLGVGVMVTGLIVLFVVADIFVIRTTEAPAAARTDLTVRAIGRQWYWTFDYPGAHAVTADELHIPAQTPVLVQVATADVIHSFWVPELNRKIDAIPGQKNAIELYADTPGIYRGECIQYCGLQHAHMNFVVYAQPRAAFQRWLARQARPADGAAAGSAPRGEQVFMQSSCSSCHTIRGTRAHGYIGPDLTHVGSRTTLASATIPNTRSELARWITSSQSIKPGNQMPDIRLSPSQLRALVDYLEALK